MKHLSGVTIGFLLLCALLGTSMGATEGGAQKALELLIEGSNKFALDLFKAVAKNNTDNIIVSPTSLMIVLSLAYTGARGLTAKEMSDVLGLPSSMEDVLIGCNQLLKDLQHPVLKLANKMFVDESMQLKEEFQKNALEYFLASAAQVDFGKSEEARQTINSWVEDNTNNKIKDLFKPGTLDSSSVLVLVNAIHFKAKWLYPFDSEMTEKEKFYVTPDTTVDVDMMSARDKFLFKHNEELGAKMLVLPYEGDDFHMVIILPDAKDGLAAVEEKLHTLDLAKEIPTFQNITVSLGLPKFKFEKTMDLNEILQGMGMKSMFANADLTGISTQGPLKVSKVVQKAFIEVNEEGTEAAAASAGVVRKKRSLGFEEFRADHPFGLVITHSASGAIVFACRITSIESSVTTTVLGRAQEEL